MTEVSGIGIIGAGVIGREHMELIAAVENARLVAVMDVDKDRAEESARMHGVRSYATLEALLNDPEI